MTLLVDYQRFYDTLTHLKESSRISIRQELRRMPPPDELTVSWFRERLKKIAPATAQREKHIIVSVLKFLKRDKQYAEIKEIRLPRIKDAVTAEDLYTKEELDLIFRVTTHPRDKAMLEVLYESACRAGELLSMTFKNTTVHKDGTATIIVSGKTGTRSIPIFISVPSLVQWMNQHPISKGPIWVRLRTPFKTIKRHALYYVVSRLLKQAEIKGKKRILHMFRHTRITELVKLNIRGQALNNLVGWSKNSNMESVYVHLSLADVETEVRSKVFGIAEESERFKPMFRPIKCPDCGTIADPQTKICQKCNAPLSEDRIIQALDEKQKTFEGFSDFLEAMQEIAPNEVSKIVEHLKSIEEILGKIAKE